VSTDCVCFFATAVTGCEGPVGAGASNASSSSASSREENLFCATGAGAEEIAAESLVPDVLPKSTPTEKSLPIKSEPTQLPTVEPTPRETPPQQPVYYNTQS
jgi:hypothetical protein